MTDPVAVYDAATQYPLEKDHYYRIRSNRSFDTITRAGEFIYLNRGCFNGLYRVNSAGHFNVPWGAPKSGHIIFLEDLQAAGEYLEGVELAITCADFELSLANAGESDLVFLDPPYTVRHNNSGFLEYNEKLFSWADQERLAVAAEGARERGATVLVTNADSREVIDLYPEFELVSLHRRSTLAGSRAHRSATREALLIGRPS